EKYAADDVGDGKLAWSAHEGAGWNLYLAAADGSGKRSLWSGAQEPRGVGIAEGRIFWMQAMPPAVTDSGPLPPLESTLQVVSVGVDGGAPQALTTLLEPEGGQVIGAHAGQLYVSAYRAGTHGITAIYRIPLTGGMALRVA